MKISGALIPVVFPHNHASNLFSMINGDMLCTWFSGTKEGRPNISVVISRMKAGNNEWDKPVVLKDDPTRSEQNPVLFETNDGKLWIIYTAQISIHQDTAIVRYRTSQDNGYTWSEPKTLFDKPGTFVRQPPVILNGGELLLPAYYSLKSDEGFLGKDYSVVKITADNGKTWSEYPIHNSEGLVHMCPVKLVDGSILGFFRSRKADRIYLSKSKDNGRTWSKPEPTMLLNNNASIQCTMLNNGHLAMVFNNVNAEISPPVGNTPPWFDKKDVESNVSLQRGSGSAVWGVVRSPLAIAISEDEGKTWPYIKNIEIGEDCGDRPEFSYPSMKQTPDCLIHISYTWLRKAIKYISITEEWVREP
jgi:predicted neuraminidase